MTQALYAHMNNKTIKKASSFLHLIHLAFVERARLKRVNTKDHPALVF
jgi:hypothetical protein